MQTQHSMGHALLSPGSAATVHKPLLPGGSNLACTSFTWSKRQASMGPCNTVMQPMISRGHMHARRHAIAIHASHTQTPAGTTPAANPSGKPAQRSKKPSTQSKSARPDADNWRNVFVQCASDGAGEGGAFMELGLKGKLSPTMPYRSVSVRPVSLKGKRHLQFSYFTEKQNVVKNEEVGSEAAVERLAQLLLPQGGGSATGSPLPFTSATLRTLTEDTSVQITKSGGAIVHTHVRAAPGAGSTISSGTSSTAASPTSNLASTGASGNGAAGPISLTLGHDRRKALPIPPNEPHPFLQKIGMQTAEGRLKADMVDKMAQVNDFLKLLAHTGVVERLSKEAESGSSDGALAPGTQQQPGLRVLDCGCGSSHLTFGTYHYLNHVLGLKASLEGVDFNAALMARSNTYSRELGLTPEQASFTAASIADYQPGCPPDIILALHACDTATDEALALGVRQGASLIMAVPCCHKHLHKQLAGVKGGSIHPMQPLMRQGIVRQRVLDLLTDTLRAQLLRICGYKVDIVEFVSTEHTPRNLLIRAVKAGGASGGKARAGNDAATQAAVEEYVALKAFWGGVTPHLETLLTELVWGQGEAAR